MKWVKSFLLAFSMYSRIPMPQVDYKEGDGQYSFCFFPAVGVVIGVLEFLWFGFCKNGMSQLATVFIATAIPLVVTGGFHVDGFLDVTDALSSYRSLDEKKRILRDPHIGAFAVIGLATAGLVFTGFLAELQTAEEVCFFAGCFALARIFSGLAAFYLPKFDENDNLAQTVAMQDLRIVPAVLWLELLAWMCGFGMLNLQTMAAEMAASAFLFCFYRWKMLREFGGTVGDTAGWYVVVQEVVYLLVLVLFP